MYTLEFYNETKKQIQTYLAGKLIIWGQASEEIRQEGSLVITVSVVNAAIC